MNPIQKILRLKDPDRIFDLICFHNYIEGKLNRDIPVEDSRKMFERIKKLLKVK